MPNSEILDRVPPHDLDAERWVIGSALKKPECIDKVNTLDPDAFHGEGHPRIWRHLLAMRAEGTPIDVVALGHRLRAAGELEAAGGAAYLLQLHTQTPVADHIVHYAEIVQECAQRRTLRDVGLRIVQNAYENTVPVGELVGKAESSLSSIATDAKSSEPVTADEAAAEVLARIEAIRNRTGHMGLPTGLVDFDDATGGLFPGELTYLAARTGIGKTALGSQIAYNAGSHGKLVLYVTLEMSAAELANRIICSLAGVSSVKVRCGDIDDADQQSLMEAATEFGRAKIIFDDRPGMTAQDVARSARRYSRNGLDLVVVDYLTRLRPTNPKLQRYEQVGQMSDALKELARSLHVPVLCLAQLNREAEKQDRPGLHHLRESGAIEQDADSVLFIHRKESGYRDGGGADRDAELIIAKNRNGQCGAIKLCWEPSATRYTCLPKAADWNPSYRCGG